MQIKATTCLLEGLKIIRLAISGVGKEQNKRKSWYSHFKKESLCRYFYKDRKHKCLITQKFNKNSQVCIKRHTKNYS